MAIAIVAQGDQLMTVGTEILVYNSGGVAVPAGVYKGYIDANQLQNTEGLILNWRIKIRSTGLAALGISYTTTLTGVVAVPVQAFGSDAIVVSCQLGLKQTSGTARTIPWLIEQIQ